MAVPSHVTYFNQSESSNFRSNLYQFKFLNTNSFNDETFFSQEVDPGQQVVVADQREEGLGQGSLQAGRLLEHSDGQPVPVPAAGQGLRLLQDEPEGASDQDGRRVWRTRAQRRSRKVSPSQFSFHPNIPIFASSVFFSTTISSRLKKGIQPLIITE